MVATPAGRQKKLRYGGISENSFGIGSSASSCVSPLMLERRTQWMETMTASCTSEPLGAVHAGHWTGCTVRNIADALFINPAAGMILMEKRNL